MVQLVRKLTISSIAGFDARDIAREARPTRSGSAADSRPGSSPAIASRAAPSRKARATPSCNQSGATSNASSGAYWKRASRLASSLNSVVTRLAPAR